MNFIPYGWQNFIKDINFGEILITRELFGKMQDGQEVYIYTLKNNQGASARITNYGLLLQSLMMPDTDGKFEDVVLGYDDLESYIINNQYFGALIGRFGNRIAYGQFSLGNKSYSLARNDGNNHSHGGTVGFDKKIWTIETSELSAGSKLTGTLVSEDGEENYPGKLNIQVEIILSDDNEITFRYEATADKLTILNPTHHSYFNISGSLNSSVLNHKLQINACSYTPIDGNMIPLGEIISVENTPFDFREMKTISRDVNIDDKQIKNGNGYDHNFVLDGVKNGKARLAATLYDPESGRVMETYTDQPGLQFYSGNFLDESIVGKGKLTYQKNCGLCFEAQHFPDSPNQPDWPSVQLAPGGVYKQITSYKFSVKSS